MADRYGRIQFYRSDPRAILELGSLHVSKSLGRVIRKGVYEVRVDRDFEGVIRACSRRRATWINEEIVRGFVALHEEGKAHSVEAYRGDELWAASTESLWAGRSWASPCSPGCATPRRSAW